MNDFENYILLNESNGNNMNCLPIDLKSVPKHHRLLCIDQHAMKYITSGLVSGLTSLLPVFLYNLPTGLVLPSLLSILGSTMIPLIKEFDAKDFRLVPRDLNEDFDSTDDGYKVKIVAINNGKVIELNNSIRDDDTANSNGNYLVIEHDFSNKKYYSLYTRLKHKSITVKKGDEVKKRQHIGNMGNTGCENRLLTLHFEMSLIPFLIGKSTENFEPYKCASLNTTEIARMETPIFKNVINNKLTMNSTGKIDSFCFLT